MSWLKTATRFHKESTKWISPPQKSYPPHHRLLQQNQPKIDIGIGVEIQKAARLSTSTRQPTLVRALIHCIPGMGLVLTTRNAPPGLCTCTASCFAIAIALALAAILQTSPQTKNTSKFSQNLPPPSVSVSVFWRWNRGCLCLLFGLWSMAGWKGIKGMDEILRLLSLEERLLAHSNCCLQMWMMLSGRMPKCVKLASNSHMHASPQKYSPPSFLMN